MGIYRGKLIDSQRPVAGIQAVLYTQSGNKLDTDVTDPWGFYQFTDIPQGPYNVYFYGGDYTDDDHITIFVAESGSNVEYYIKPTNGSVIKNGTGTLTVQLQSIINGELSVVTEGPIKLYVKDGSENFTPLWEESGVTGTKYEAAVPASLIEGTLDVFAIAEKGTPDEFLYDSITLADLTDGVGFIGWVEPTSYLTVLSEDGTFSPDTITVSPKFAVDGVEVTPSDPAFTFDPDGVPDDQTGVVVDDSTGVAVITSENY